ncbi:MAG: hypothetical protein JWM57_1772, partial [Phycisphaerales bacterium]|nr:hypothetical protein [Phycisphaerales bacterium]
LAAMGNDVYRRAESQRGRKLMAATHESVVMSEAFSFSPPNDRFRATLIAGLQAARQKAPLDDGRVIALVHSCSVGVDFDLVWREYLGLTYNGQYPVASGEFPKNWEFGISGTQRQLARLIWLRAKSLPSGKEREETAKAAIAVASMRRECSGMPALSTIVFDSEFQSVSGLSQDAAMRLNQYASVSSDSVADSVAAVRRLREALNHPRTADVLKLLSQSFACGRRLPEVSYCVTRLVSRAPESIDKKDALEWLKTISSEDGIVQENLALGTMPEAEQAVMTLVAGE